MIMPIHTCQNCVLGLQWNMKIKCKVEKKKKKEESNKRKKKKTQEMIDKLKTRIKKQTHAERERKIQDLKNEK